MNTSHNHLREPGLQESSFVRAKGYLSDLSKPEKEILLENLGVGSGKILVENFPDEEDLTQKIQGGQNVLKFKDKIFNPAVCSGMGKVYLRKNLIKDIHHCKKNMNILTQKMFEDEHGLPLINTIFIVQYDYDLDKGFITIPDNSILVFAGGSFTNGTVMLRNTLILPAGLDVERFMAVNIRGTYKEGSLVYLRKRLRLFNGETWVSLGGPGDFGPRDTCELINLLKSYVNAALDIVSPFKITLTPEKNYIEKGEHDIKVSWNYNRLITNQDIRLESGTKYSIYKELDKKVREYTFEGIDTEEPVTIVISTTYKGETVSEAITLDFNQNPGLIIDDELDEESTNPVTNRAITRAIRSLEVSIQTGLADLLALIRQEFLTKADAENIYLKKEDFDLSDIYDALDGKVDKEAGKGLSSNDFTNALKNKLEGINLDNYALKNHTHSNYADVNHTHSEYALVNHTHVISDIAGLEEALNRADVTYTLSKNGNNIILTGSDGSTSTVAISGIDENTLKTLIQAKLRLVHGTGNISLTYDGTNLATVPDEKGSSEGGITEDEVKELIKENLDVTHVGDLIKLKYGNTIFGNGTTDMTGEGGGGGDDDSLPGNILTYFIATTSSTVPNTPPDGLLPPEGSDWSVNCPDREEGRYIWMSQIYETYSQTHYGNWSEPILLSDGSLSSGSDTSDREYIYARANIEDWKIAGIPNPNNNPERWPSESGPWYDNPQGVTQELRFEFISFKYKTSEDRWSDWQGPYIWSSYGRNGTDGDGVEYIFFAGNSTPTGNDDPFTWYNDNDSKSGGSDDYGVLFNSDEYIPRGSQWKDDPQELIPGQTQWVSTRKYRNDVDPQSSEQEDSYWHQYSHPTIWNHYAQDITSAGALDFDNQTMGIPVDTEGNNLDFVDTSDGYIYYGTGDIPIQLLTCNGLFDGDNPIWTQQLATSYVRITDNHVTVNIPAGTLRNIIGKTYTLRFTATAANVEPRTGVIKLVGLTTGSDGCSYKLKVNTRVIKSGVGTSSGQNIPDRIVPQMLKTKGAVPEAEYSVTNLPSGFTIEYLKDNETSTQQLRTDDISTLAITDKVLLQLKYNDFIIDEELIFVIQDGVEGIPATVYNIVPLSSSVSWDPETNKTTGTLTFEAYRKIGANTEEYLSGGKFGTSTDIGSIDVKLDNHTVTASESQHIYTANIDSNGQYSVIQIDLSVSSPLTKVASIIIPIIQKGASGSQTLLLGIMRYRLVDCLDGTEGVTFYDGRNPDPEAQNGYFQDFVIWNGANSKDWGTYLCINKVNLPPAAIPYDGISNGYFTKMDHTFGEIVDYLIAHRAWIDELSVRQVVVFDGATPKPNIVAGMTSGNTLPTELTEKSINNSLGIRIWAGRLESSDLNSAPFTVDSNGHVKANDITINGSGSFTGTVTATSGSFKGEVQATSFEVMSNNEVQMYLTTWGELKNDVQILNVDLSSLDETTAGSLTDNTPVIAMKQGSSYYLLTPLLLRQSSGRKAETYYTFSKQMILGSEDYYRVKEGEYKTLYYDSNDKLYYTQLSGGSPFNDNNMNYYKKTDSTNVILKGTVNSIISDIDKYECYTFTSGTRNTGSPILIGDVWMITPAATGSGSSISTLNGLKIDYIPDSEEDITGREETFNNETFTPGTHDNVNPSDPGRINGTVFGISTSSPIKRVIYAKPNRTSSTIEPYSAVSKIEVKSSAANSGWLNNSI